MPIDAHGVREDPATGNGAAFLGTYLLEHQRIPGTDLSLRIDQGYEGARPSRVMLALDRRAGRASQRGRPRDPYGRGNTALIAMQELIYR